MMTTKQRTLGLYLHVPFCAAKCRYCDFYSAPAGAEVRRAYVAALCRHAEALAARAADRMVDTVYFGGGTPTLLGGEAIAEVLTVLKQNYRLAPDAEITVECNPVTNAEGLFEPLVAAGVNRVSIGLQSASAVELAALGRLHSAADFTATVAAATKAGISNISADVMLGIPHQTEESLRQTLSFLLSHPLAHISAYGLRVEEGTPFHRERAKLVLPEEDTVAAWQDIVTAVLAEAGFSHYEVSNYARAGRGSRHNLRYWRCLEYLGIGPAAHSYFEGVRYQTPADTGAYIAAVSEGRFEDLIIDREEISLHEAREEYVMLGMRLFEGLSEAEFYARFGTTFEEAYGPLDRYLAAGLLTRSEGRIAFTERGMLVSNAILSEWLNFE